MRPIVYALAAMTVLLSTSFAHAQDASQIGAYYRQYNEALARNDLPAAETAAAAALSASIQRDGQGGRTAILAFNLARVRLEQQRWQEARAPAQQAYDLSRNGAAVGVDPVMAELLWGRVRMISEGIDGAQFLQNALQRSAARADLAGDRYDAADALGTWAAQSDNFLIARQAWAWAGDASSGAPFEAAFARGRARAYEAIAMAKISLSRSPVISPVDARQIRERLREAYGLVRPFAFAASPSGQLTAPQQVYAQILAWDGAIWSKLASDDPSLQSGPQLDADPASVDGVALCRLRRTQGEAMSYPGVQAQNGQLGAVVLRLRFDETGQYLGADVAASVGDDNFEQRVLATASSWFYAADAAPGCKAPAVFYVPITFTQHQ
jgi:TonB family protein